MIVANPVTVALRELGLEGTYSHTKFIPECYLHNAPDVRIAVLQGLLDSDGGPVTQRGRTCRIQYTTCSETLRDDVVHLVQSLGGVAYWRRREARGRRPGGPVNRPIHHRRDSFVMDLRVPETIEPFRLQRKLERYRRDGGGRPMRLIESIEAAGETETVCIAVAAADSLYVTDEFLVTHNTLNDSFIILDEAQNTSPEQMQMFLTRLGFGSKVVVTGDVTQIDLPREQRVRPDPGAATSSTGSTGSPSSHFGHQDVVRHKLVQRIVEAYREHAEETGTERSNGVMLTVEVDNRSGMDVDEGAAVELACRVLRAEGIDDGELGVAFVGPDEMRELKREHLGDRRGDRRALVPDRRPRRAAGRAAARARRRRPLPAGRRRGVARAAHARAAAPARLRPRRGDGAAGSGAPAMRLNCPSER